ncbi:MAG: GNAT family N-acetyltransferase [Clostridia bacterium]|nr:GNAT family N-acetyltransferase [Clostridia bacterium]
MKLVKIEEKDAGRLAPLAADFRVRLKKFRGIESVPDKKAGKTEIIEFLRAGFPVYAAEENGDLIGYIVCRIDEPCLWVEHFFVSEEHRGKGVGTLLFAKAEELAAKMGEDTVYNFVHPNNETMIRFLRSRGYTVLNMIEIRKPYKGEKTSTTVKVGNEVFDY